MTDADKDMAWMASRLRQMGCELLAADDLAHEVYRYFHGIEPTSVKRSGMKRALNAYLRQRHPSAQEPPHA